VDLTHIRNVISRVRAIARHMAEREASEEAALHLAGRIAAIGRAAKTPPAYGMDFESLVLDELLAQGVLRSSSRIDGPDVQLNAKSAELMSLVIHELATNSIKFGALSQPQTHLRVLWWFADPAGSRLHIEWAEEGVRMPDEVKRIPGFGSQVITRLIATELHGAGAMSFLDQGILCTIDIPLREALQKNE
jgi:two-component sensor histidine kinase